MQHLGCSQWPAACGHGPVPQEGQFPAGAALASCHSRCVCASHTARLRPSSWFSTAALLFPLQVFRLQESCSPPGEMQGMNHFTSTLLNNWCMKYVSIGTPTDVS